MFLIDRWIEKIKILRFAEVAELVDCTCLDIYGALPAAALTPAAPYAAYLVYGTAGGGHRGLSYPDQETAVAVGGRVVARHAVCLRPDDAEARKFRGGGGGGAPAARSRGGRGCGRTGGGRWRWGGWARWRARPPARRRWPASRCSGGTPSAGSSSRASSSGPSSRVLPDENESENVHVSRFIFSMSKLPR